MFGGTELAALRAIVGDDGILQGASVERAYDCDAYTVDRSSPTAIALPSTTEQVSQLVQWCNSRNVAFTARGAGTGLSGGAMPALGGLVISTKRLNQILVIDIAGWRLLAQAGVVNAHVSRAVAAHGLHFAPDPSSQSVSTIGGNIAENSGGPHTLKYGVTAPHVLGCKLVLPNGEIVSIDRHEDSPDLLSLVIGAEGLLGIVTEAWLRLTPVPERVETVLISFSTIRDATETVAAIIGAGILPAALELMDRRILDAVRQAFGLEFPEATQSMLLVECDGDPVECKREIEQVFELAKAPIEARLAQSEEQRASFWMARKKGIGAMGRLAPTIVTHDGVIPPSKLPEMLEFVYEVAEQHQVGVANLFHAGDGNLHPCFYFDDREPGAVERVVNAGEAIMRRCIELGGSLTGEHGIGIEKLDMMPLMFSEADLEMQGWVRDAFNPTNLCNPCKVIPNQKGCIEHRRRWRGAAT
ncbi:MAG: FAD-binding protein [Chthonomonas sp.]|nr:FAD-binding protein [Chthonomonas sp.]